MAPPAIDIVNLTNTTLLQTETRAAAKWMAKAFEDAPATPALNIFFAAAPYRTSTELHEAFWSSHLNRVARSGVLLGARVEGEWRGFRCFFPPGKGREAYVTEFRLDGNGNGNGNEDWDRFLALADPKRYAARVAEWGRVAGETSTEIGLVTDHCFTTSIIVVDPMFQRRGIGHALDEATRRMVHDNKTSLFVRIHEYILPFYQAQGYRVLASPTYTLLDSEPFKVHFLMHDCE